MNFIEGWLFTTSSALAMFCEFLFEHSPHPVGCEQRDQDDQEREKDCSVKPKGFSELFFEQLLCFFPRVLRHDDSPIFFNSSQ